MNEGKMWEARCACGELSIRLAGDPQYVSSCCCQACQRRSGSFYAVTAFFAHDQVLEQRGPNTVFRRIGDSGKPLDFHFCPSCGSTVWWEPGARPDRIAVAGGCFADKSFPSPQRLIWTEERHPSICVADDLPTFERAPS
ncbi:GFA family protein [Phenylobacterium sp.]|uniref:GFA family protein n=1 Tax=Phenylobacterium sp. TaxID=1871053 RepID=UPI002F93E3B9